MAQDARGKFANLDLPPLESTLQYSTASLSTAMIKIGKSKANLPVLLIQHDGKGTKSTFDQKRFRNLFLRTKMENEAGDYFAVLELTSDDQGLIDCFFDLLPKLCENLQHDITVVRLEMELTKLISLLTTDSRHSRLDLVGLWAELLVIKLSSNPEYVVDAWHIDHSAKWDFLAGGASVEVKSTTGDRRRHRFSLEQFLRPENLLLVSIMLRISKEDGLSLQELIADLLDTFTGNTRAKIQNIASQIVGDDVAEAEELKFNLEDAISSLKYYRATDVPHIKYPPPHGVTDVRYQSDLEHAQDYSITNSDPELWVAICG